NVKLCFQKSGKIGKSTENTTKMPSERGFQMGHTMTAKHQSDTLLHRLNTLPPKRYGVFLLNDDYTTMEFVVEILTEIFMLGQEQAVAVMLLVHHEGKGLCGTYTRDIAQTKQQQVMQRAKAEGHPLQCIVEEI
ncbi:ATP-dependent Clp protease adapter ClpS, partial [Enterobacter hormaechei subsp. steigerwaltii]|nr:ATP-dependent Clp protease adapter ClpS [Enterobacter hormaechei subsp. steigerwaltii]